MELRKRLEERQIRVEMSEAARNFVADAAYDPVYGARPLRRYLQQQVETPLAREIISGSIRDGQNVLVDVSQDQLVFRAE